MSEKSFLVLLVTVTLVASFHLVAFASDEPDWRVDTRIELASVLCRLAGYEEYQEVRVPAYDRAVNEHFARYRDHAAVKLMSRLRKERDIGFNAAPELALLASDASSWTPRVPLHPLPSFLDSRWNEPSAQAFFEAARSFARDTHAGDFFKTQSGIHSSIERAHCEQFAGRIDLAWYRSHFRVPKGTAFHVLPAPLTGSASYGIGIHLPEKGLEVYAVLALPRLANGQPISLPVDDASELVVHEFCHPFVNPWVDAHGETLRAAAAKCFAEMQETMQANAYSNWKTMVYESLVRAATVRYFLDHGKPNLASVSLLDDRFKGFWWTEDLARVFQTDGSSPVTLDMLEPQISAFFTEWAANLGPRIARKKAELATRGPQIVSLAPRDGDTEVDPGVGLLEIRFDRPMARTASIKGDTPEVTERPAWDESKTVFRIPVTFRAGQRYIIFLNKAGDGGFRSEAGERLTPQVWQFQVKK